MAEKTNGKVFWQTKDGDKRLMISWMARKGETKIPIPPQETKIIPIMMKMDVAEADVEFILQSGTPRNIEFVNKDASDEAKQKVSQQAKIQEQNAEKVEQSFEVRKEELKTVEKPIDTNYSKDFHNPYNFVPAIPRDKVTGELADREPSGHSRYLSEMLSGKLRIKMTVKTPLLLPDTARMIYDKQKDHRSFPVRVGADGKKPFINPTAVKGMLRSAYEAVTNSRLSIFTKHEDRLAFRAEVKEGLFVVPAKIEGAKGNEKIVFYTGKSEIEEDGGPKITQHADRKNRISEIRQSQYAAWIRMYETNNFDTANGEKIFAMSRARISLKNTAGDNPKHPKKAWAWIEEFNHGKFKYWEVMEIAYDQADLSAFFPKTADSISASPEKVEGYICNTGKTMKSKHDERFFFGRNSTCDIDLEKHHIDFWESLIKNYRKQHESDFNSPPKEKVRGGANDGVEYSLEWSRQIQRTTKEETSEKANLIEEELKDGTLCYARVKWNGSNFEVLELYPVMISRRLHKFPPTNLLHKSLKPATDINKLSPAERVFGWVGKGIPKNGNYRGQVRFGEVTTEETDAIQFFKDDLPLNILGQPKPQQGRFYVAEDKNGNAQTIKGNNEESGYNSETEKGLRGRKIYPHQAHIEGEEFWFQSPAANFTEQGDYWNEEFTNSKGKKYFREYLRPRKDNKQQRDSQNRSLQGWVKPDTEFEFDIHFTNLSEVELGALVWLLSLPDEHFHRFGGGKPLGFGSVRLDLADSEIYEGKELKKRYESLDAVSMTKTEAETCKTEFEEAVKSAYPNSNFLKAFEFACKGFEDKLPIHYPRIKPAPNAEGKSFEWFVANSNSRDGFKLALPNLSNEIGLPRIPKN